MHGFMIKMRPLICLHSLFGNSGGMPMVLKMRRSRHVLLCSSLAQVLITDGLEKVFASTLLKLVISVGI